MTDFVERAIHTVRELAPRWLGPSGGTSIPQDLSVLDSGIAFCPDRDALDYFWYRLEVREGEYGFSGYRVVRLLQLRFLPLEARADAGLLQKMRTVLRGLYGSQVDLIYLVAGIFNPPVGILQCYGVATFSPNLDQAVEESRQHLAALRAALAGAYRQIRVSPLDTRLCQWIFSAFSEMKHTLVTVGHPDPREAARSNPSAALRNPLTGEGHAGAPLSMQQNEILFRGMADLKEEFLYLVLTSPVGIEAITEMLAGLAEHTAAWSAWQTGSRAASFGISLPAILSGALAQNTGMGYSTGEGISHTDGAAHSTGLANSSGSAHTTGHASSYGWSHTVSEGEAVSTGTANTVGQATTEGSAHTESHSVTDGSSHTEGSSSSSSHVDSFNWGLNGGLKGGVVIADGSIGANVGWGSADGYASSSMSSDTTSHAETNGQADTTSHAQTNSTAATSSASVTHSRSESWGTSGSITNSTADTTSQSVTNSQSDTTSQADSRMQNQTASQMLGHGVSAGLSVGVAPSFSISNSYQWQNDPVLLVTHLLRMQQQLLLTASKEGAYYTDVYALSRSADGKRALMGLIPEAFHGTEDVITGVQTRDLTQAEEAYIHLHARTFTPSTRVESVPEVLSGYADSTLLTMLQTAAYTAPGMFEQGTALTVQESTPEFAYVPEMPGDVVLGHLWSVETGALTGAQLKLTPERHFHTAFVGDTGFGKTVSAERLAYETTLRWHYRTIVLDFGQGWRKALNWPGLAGRVDIRQLYPGAVRPIRWNPLQVPRRIRPVAYRNLVVEMFANAGRMGARQLGFMREALTTIYKNAGVLVIPEGEELFEESEIPDFPRGKKDDAEDERETRRQRYIRDLCALRSAYRFVRSVKEEEAINRARMEQGLNQRSILGSSLSLLTELEKQALYIFRSRACSLVAWVKQLRQLLKKHEKDLSSRTSLQGVLLRIDPLAEGEMQAMYGPGEDTIAIEDLGLLGPEEEERWGITIIEGGAEMDEYAKAALFSLLDSILYLDAVKRRRESLDGRSFPPMQIFFEEANKIISGVSGGAASDQGGSTAGKSQVSETILNQFRDGRKYRVLSHILVQTVSETPDGLLSSCGNLFIYQTKNPKDRDLVLAHIGRSEKGIVNTEYKRYLARIPREYAVVKLGYSTEVADMEPMLVHPLIIRSREPSDGEILARLSLSSTGG